MSKPLEIQILAKLNETLSTQQINKQLGSISKNVNINLGIDTKGLNEITKKVDDLQKQVKSKLSGFKIIDADVATQELNKVDGEFRKLYRSIDEAVNHYKQFGTVKVNTNLDPITKEIQSFNLQVEKGGALVEKLKFDLAQIAGSDQRVFEISKIGLTDNTDKLNEKQLQQEHQIRKKLQDDAEKQAEQEQKINKQLQEQLDLYKRQASINATNLTRRYGDAVDSNGLKAYLESVNALSAKTPDLQHKMKDLNLSFKELSANVSTSGSHMLTFAEAFKTAMVKFPIWMAASTAFFQSLRFISDGISYVNDLNKSLTQVAIVTGKTQDQVSQLGEEYQKLAYNMGVTTQNFADAAVEYYRQGLTQQEVMDRANKTIQYAKISNLDFAKSAEILTATTNSMNVSIEHATDVFSYLGDATATGADEIGIAFQKVGGTAGALQVPFEKVSSWIAEISSRTRESAETIGNSIRSILARMQSLKETGFTEDGQNINQVAKSLDVIGIKLLDAKGQFRNFGTVMDEVGSKWKDLDSRTKAYIATTLAGTYQQSRFENLMEGYSDSVKLYDQSLNAAGTTQKKFDIYMQSTEAHLNKLKDAWSGVFQDTFHSDTINAGIDLLTGMANGVGNLVHTFGTLPIAVGLATTAIIAFNDSMRAKALADGQAFFSNLKQLPSTFKEISITARAAAVSEGIFAGAEEALAIATRGLGIALKTTFSFLAGAVLPIAGFMALGYAVEKVTGYFVKQHQELQKQKEEVKQLTDSYKQHSDEVDSLVGKYEKLSNQVQSGSLSSNDKEYLDVQQKIADILPNTVSYIDSESQAHLKNVGAVKEEIKYLKQLQAIDYKKQIANFNDDFKNVLKNINSINAQLDNLKKKEKTGFEPAYDPFSKSATWQDTLKSLLPNPFEDVPLTKGDRQKSQIQASYDLTVQEKEEALQKQNLIDLTQQLEQAYASLNKSTGNLTDADNAFIGTLIEKKKNQIEDADSAKKVASQMSDVAIAIGKIRDVVGQNADISQLFKGFSSKQIEETSVLFDLFNQGKISIDDVKKSMTDYGISSADATQATNVLTDAQKQNANVANSQKEAQDTLTKVLQGQISVEDALSQAIFGRTKADIDNNSKLIEIYSALSHAANLNDEQTQLLIQTREKLAEQYPDLVNGAKVNIQGMYNEINAENVLYQAVVASAQGQLDAEHQKTLGLAQELMNQKKIIQQQINLYTASFDAMMASHDGRLALNSGLMNQFHMMESAQRRLNSVVVPGIQKAAISLGKYLNISPTFKTPSWNYDTGGKSKGTKGGGTPSQPVEKHETDAFSQSLANLEAQLKKVQATQNDYTDKTSKGYIDALKQQINLIQQEKSLTQKQIKTLESQTDSLKRQRDAMGSFSHLSNDQKQHWNDLSQSIDDNVNKINELNGQLVSYGENVQDLQNQIKQVYSDTADNIIDIMKDMYDKEKQLALDANQKKMDLLDSEMQKYQESVKQQMDAIDNQENNTSYLDNLAAKQKDVADLQTQLDKLSLDNSVEGEYRKQQIDEELKQKQKELADFQHQHEVELRKQNLQDSLDAKQKEVDQQKTQLEKERDQINEYWDNVINDERKWTDVRNQILQGHFDQINSTLADFTKVLKDHMDEIGQSISQNLLDKIDDAEKKLNNLKDQSIPNNPPPQTSTPTPTNTNPSNSSSSGSSSSGNSSNTSSETNNSSLPLRKRPGGYATPSSGWNHYSVIDELKSHGYYATFDDREKLYHALHGGSYSGTQSQNDWLLKKLKIIGLRTGGYTGANEGLAYLHDYETVLNKHDSDNFLEAVKITRQMFNYIQKPNIPDFQRVDKGVVNNINMNVNIDKLTGDQAGAKQFFEIIGNEMHKKGRW